MRIWLTIVMVPAVFAQSSLIPHDHRSVEAGKQIYMGSCSGCHGATGEGSQGPALLSGRASRLPDRTLLSSIKNGLPGTSMPNFPMDDEKVAQVAAFVRSLTAPAIRTTVAGDAERGKRIFYETGKCSTCHMIQGKGGNPGPDLSNIGAERTQLQLRESILKPSARIADGFRSGTVRLSSGQMIEGVVKNHNNYSVQILDRNGRVHLLKREDVAKLDIRDDSLMPAVTNSEDVIHLIAFLARQSMRAGERSTQ